MVNERYSGILLHPTSLPGKWGTGDLGEEAFDFVDFLSTAEQRLWQILPLGPTGMGDSPYNAQSSAAGNLLLIDPRRLVPLGLLGADDLSSMESLPEGQADFDAARRIREPLLRAAYERFCDEGPVDIARELERFRRKQADWLDDYALFEALREDQGGTSWIEWDESLARREPRTLEQARVRLADKIGYQEFVQFLFDRQWSAVRHYANERGIRIIGDIPIYVAFDSADVWAHQDLYKLDETGHPTVVAGVPPDIFSESGQLWGNPCYRWDVMRERGYDWWIDRFRRTLELCDIVRVDHFRAFQAGWEVPAGEETAIDGEWVPGPGESFFERVEAELGTLPIIVEDLGIITEDVHELRDALGFPGMKVLQFAFGEDAANPYLPHNYEPNCVVYTGTHDNDTTVGWYESLDESQRDHVDRYLGPHDPDIAWALIRLALSSVAQYAIVPLQDVLSLGNEARMNLPGTTEDNWSWRMEPGALTDEQAQRLAVLATTFGRVPRAEQEPDR